jgi:small subunit ribosomal protein S20
MCSGLFIALNFHAFRPDKHHSHNKTNKRPESKARMKRLSPLTFAAVRLNSAPFYAKRILIMPNTKSAERRMRGNERKHQHNRSVKSSLRGLEKNFRAAVAAGKKDEAKKLLPAVHSALDKAVKSGVLARPAVNRKKSRLTLSLN